MPVQIKSSSVRFPILVPAWYLSVAFVLGILVAILIKEV